MHFTVRKKRIAIFFLSCILLWGMCSGNVETDSSFACADIIVSDEEDACSASVLQPVGKAVPMAQAYEHESFEESGTALVLRHTVRRTTSRTGRSGSAGYILSDVFSTSLLSFSPVRAHTDFQEIISNTVIMEYIHRKDGQKSRLLYFI